jgi:soluble lytic murein transglycosylase-like protein
VIDSMFQEGTDAALDDQVTRPKPAAPPPNSFSTMGLLAAPFRGIGAGVSKSIAFGAEIAGAFGQVAGAYDIGPNATPEQQKQADAARQKVLTQGIDYSNEAGDTFRQRAADILPDPKTAHASAQVVAGLADFATRAVGYSVTLGPLAPFVFGGDAATEESDRLKQQGVDLPTRTKAGAVAGVLNAAAVAVPMTGATALTRAAKGVAVGEGTIVGQSAAERAILRSTGYDKIADSFDPLDPVALAVGVVPGALGARFGHAAAKPGAPAPRGLLDMGLGERQALRYDDVRLDFYAVEAAKREGIPPEVLLAVKNAGEKSGSTATSPKGAQGVMQFMPGTFKEFGRGDPTDPLNSIDAGAKFLRKLHDTYGDWDAAIAHYNGGGRQAAAVRSGGTPVPETAAYLARVRAYMGKTGEEHIAAAVQTEPDLVPAARVMQTAQALDGLRLTPDDDLAGRDAHLSAVETASDQLGSGQPVEVADRIAGAMDQPMHDAPEMQAARAVLDRVDSGGIPLNPAKLRDTAEGLGLEVSRDARPEETVQRIRDAVQRADDAAQSAARIPAMAAAAEQLRAARQPAEPQATQAPRAAVPPPTEDGAKPASAPQAASAGAGEAQAPATVARAAAEAATLNPDMLVHLEGMDAPMRVGDLLAKVQEEAAQDVRDGKLLEVAAACDLTA